MFAPPPKKSFTFLSCTMNHTDIILSLMVRFTHMETEFNLMKTRPESLNCRHKPFETKISREKPQKKKVVKHRLTSVTSGKGVQYTLMPGARARRLVNGPPQHNLHLSDSHFGIVFMKPINRVNGYLPYYTPHRV